MHMSSQASHVHSWRLFASALWFHFLFWKLKLANQKVPDLNLHTFRYFFKSTIGKPLQVWLHVCAWWITSWRVCRRVLNDLDFLDRVIGADCVNGCCSLRNAWVLTSHCLSSCLTLNVASKSDRRRRRNHVCVGTDFNEHLDLSPRFPIQKTRHPRVSVLMHMHPCLNALQF